MRFSVIASLLFSSLALAAPKENKGFEVVIHYVDAPDCDVQCGVNTTSTSTTSTSIFSSSTSSEEQTTTYTSTSTKYVIVTLQTGYGSTETLGYETASTLPIGYETSSTATATTAAPTY